MTSHVSEQGTSSEEEEGKDEGAELEGSTSTEDLPWAATEVRPPSSLGRTQAEVGPGINSRPGQWFVTGSPARPGAGSQPPWTLTGLNETHTVADQPAD